MVNENLAFAAMAEFADTLVQRYAIADVLSQLTEQVPPVLEIFGAGVSVGDDQRVLRFATASSEALTEVERVQDAAREGPCVDAYRTGQFVTTDDLKAERRWPQYRSVALAAGCQSVAAIPLHAAGVAIGSMNLYATDPAPGPRRRSVPRRSLPTWPRPTSRTHPICKGRNACANN